MTAATVKGGGCCGGTKKEEDCSVSHGDKKGCIVVYWVQLLTPS